MTVLGLFERECPGITKDICLLPLPLFPARLNGVDDPLKARIVTDTRQPRIFPEPCNALIALAYGAVKPLDGFGSISQQRKNLGHMQRHKEIGVRPFQRAPRYARCWHSRRVAE